MPEPSHTSILRDAEAAWFSLDEATAGLVDLDFGLPFFPELLVRGRRLSFLNAEERLLLSQIRAYAYVGVGILAKRFVLPFVMSRAAGGLRGESERFLALMGYGHASAKHIVVFEAFAAAVERGFDVPWGIIGPSEEISARFLSNDDLAVALLVQHMACASQTHYVRGARSSAELCGPFRNLLRLHWREEAQHAKLAGLIVGELAREASQHERARALEQYVGILDELSRSVRRQVELDMYAFEHSARPLTEAERAVWRHEQGLSYDEVYVFHGASHPQMRHAVTTHFGSPIALDEAADRYGDSARSEERPSAAEAGEAAKTCAQ